MSTLEPWLTRLEARLQALIEGAAARLLPAGKPEETEVDPASNPEIEQTAPMTAAALPTHPPQPLPTGAFLVVDGMRCFPLERAVISIGRDPKNDLVLNDQRVSRQHAQLRASSGRFVVFDLDSTGGTNLNGQPVQSHPLTPGDVISLAGVPLVYGQENPPGAEHTQELHLQEDE